MKYDVVKDENSYKPPPTDSQWLKFPEGTTTIRLLSHSIHFQNHYYQGDKKTYDCTGDVSTCQHCQQGNKTRHRWAYLVLLRDPKAPSVKTAEFGWTIFKSVLDLSKDPDYGDPRGYDLKVTRTGSGKESEYTVFPGKETAFNDKEKALLANQKLDQVEEATKKLMSAYSGKVGQASAVAEEEVSTDEQ